jgi:peptide subunit release factor RF-3
MINPQSAVIRYEKARQLVASLKAKRRELIDQCESIVTIEDGFFQRETGELCLITAYKDFRESEYEDGQATGFNYGDALSEVGCEACLQSFKIKHTTLSVARKEFGIAKRSLSNLGKRLIKEANKPDAGKP